jgi:hypothetical protein
MNDADVSHQIESFLLAFLNSGLRLEVTLLPFQRSLSELMAVIGISLPAKSITLDTAWPMTLPLARKLHDAGLLGDLRGLEVILCAVEDDGVENRVLKFGIRPEKISCAGLSKPDDLVKLEDTPDMFCHWYISLDTRHHGSPKA